VLRWSDEHALHSFRYQRKPGGEDVPQAGGGGGGGGGRVRRAAAAARRCGGAQLAAAREAASWGLLVQARRRRVCGGCHSQAHLGSGGRARMQCGLQLGDSLLLEQVSSVAALRGIAAYESS